MQRHKRLHRARILAKDLSRPVYTIDLRNHGESPHHPIHTYTAMAEDVESFVRKQSIPNPLLIGHSMGAKVAMTLALRQPTKYSGLVPVDNAPIDAALKSDFGTYVNAMKEIEDHRPRIQKQSEADKVLEKYEKDVGIRQFLLTNFVKTPVATEGERGQTGVRSEMRFRIPLQTLAKALPDMADFPFKDPEDGGRGGYGGRFEGPTLVVRGTKSHYVSDESLPLIGQFFPRFEVLDVESGHWVMSEKLEDFRKGVGEWVGRVVDRE